ncbi:MAG: carbamoyl phosphate synthase large subunit, partial [Mariprofundaceae bacterium]
KSTGEVMGIAADFPTAYNKAQLGASVRLPCKGRAFLSVRDMDKPAAVQVARVLRSAGFDLLATQGTHIALLQDDIESTVVAKVTEGVQPHIVDRLNSGDVALVINTTEGAQAIADSKSIRQATLIQGIPYFTTMEGGLAAAEAISSDADVCAVKSLQAYHEGGEG